MTTPYNIGKLLSPGRLLVALCLATLGCAVVMVSTSLGPGAGATAASALRAQRLLAVHDIVSAADAAKSRLTEYETSGASEDRDAFVRACDTVASLVGRLRQIEHMADDSSDQIADLCVRIRQQLSRVGNSSADRMLEAGYLLDRIRHVVVGLGLDEVRVQDERLAEQSSAAAASRRTTACMAATEALLVAGMIFLVTRVGRLEKLATVCAWTQRVRHEGQWISLEKYLERKFGIRPNEGVTPEQAERILADEAINGHELLRLIEFEKAATDLATETHRAIHAVRNHLTAVLCFSELAGMGDTEAQRDMANRVLSHAHTISNEVDHLHSVVRSFQPQPAGLRVVRSEEEEKRKNTVAAA